jgi:hypothetical protein
MTRRQHFRLPRPAPVRARRVPSRITNPEKVVPPRLTSSPNAEQNRKDPLSSFPASSLLIDPHPRTHFFALSAPETRLFSVNCKRVRNSLKTRNIKPLSFHTHAHSFAASHVFSTLSHFAPGVHIPAAKETSLLALAESPRGLATQAVHHSRPSFIETHVSPVGWKRRARSGKLPAARWPSASKRESLEPAHPNLLTG